MVVRTGGHGGLKGHERGMGVVTRNGGNRTRRGNGGEGNGGIMEGGTCVEQVRERRGKGKKRWSTVTDDETTLAPID